MNVKSALLNDYLDEDIYMSLPPGFDKEEGIIWKLNKPLYSLKQARQKWYKMVCAEFEALGLYRCQSDHSVFYKNKDGWLLIVAIYINDMLILRDDTSIIEHVKTELKNWFKMMNLGEAH